MTVLTEEQALSLPIIRIVCGRSLYAPDTYHFAVMWGRNLDAQEGESVYRHQFGINWHFRIWLRRY